MLRHMKRVLNKPILGSSLIFILLIFVFFFRIFVGELYSPSNLFYHMPPWNIEQNSISTHGSLLSDPLDYYMPNMYYFKNELAHGHIPLWSSFQSMGSSMVVDSISLLFSPNTIIYLLFPLTIASTIDLMFKLFLSSMGMFLFLHKLKINIYASRIGAIVFTFALPMIVWLNWPHMLVSCLAPWLFLGVQNILESNKKWIPITALVIAFMIFGNMPAYVAYYIYAAGSYYLFVITRDLVKSWNFKQFSEKVNQFLLTLFFSVGIAAVYILSFFHYMSEIKFVEQRINLFKPFPSLKYLIALLDSNYFTEMGIPVLHFNEYSGYFGITSLVLFFVSIVYMIKFKNINILFWLVSAIVIGLVIYGSPLTNIFGGIPGVGTSLATRLLGLQSFLVSVVVACTVSHIVSTDAKRLLFAGVLLALILITTLGLVGFVSLGSIKINFSLLFTFCILSMFVIILMLYGKRIFSKNVFLAFVTLLIIIDVFKSGIFYNPSVAFDEATLNPETQTTRFLQENLGSSRFVSLGDWNLFPNTSTYYGINDLRGHSFLLRNPRNKHFNETIDPESYTTVTRTEFNTIKNYHLLNAASVKYIIAQNMIGEFQPQDLKDASNSLVAIGEILKGDVIEQSFISRDNQLDSVAILFATYQRKLIQGEIQMELIDDHGQVIRKNRTPMNKLADNEYFYASFEPIKYSKGKQYKLRLTVSNIVDGQAVTVWATDKKAYKDGDFSRNGQKQNSSIMFKLTYKNNDLVLVNKKDNQFVYENKAAFPRVYLVDRVSTISDPDEILRKMSMGQIYNQAFVEENIGNFNNSGVEETHKFIGLQNFLDQGDNITFNVETDRNQFLILTDNYIQGWTAYIDGVETKVYRTNYTFKGIKLPEGRHTVIFKYNPPYFKIGLIITLISFATVIGLLISSYFSVPNRKVSRQATQD
ncbi:Bacterial membrane protein YfhO [compost metagenome]